MYLKFTVFEAKGTGGATEGEIERAEGGADGWVGVELGGGALHGLRLDADADGAVLRAEEADVGAEWGVEAA